MASKQTTIDYNPEEYLEDNPDFELPLLSELMGSTFEMSKVVFNEASKGTYAIVTIDKKDYRTSSGPLVDKLLKMHDVLEKGNIIRVSLQKKTTGSGTYFYFDVPK